METLLSNRNKNSNEKKRSFWATQPINKELENTGDISKVPKTPTKLPKGYEWDLIDIQNDEQLKEICEFLSNHYVEDSEHTLRFKYSKEFLLWALSPPGYKKEWHVCVRGGPKRQMFALITGTPASVSVEDKILKMAEINFLCIHEKFRSKRLAPVLIKEITRRINLFGVWQAIYTVGSEISPFFSKNRYYHREINKQKLIDIKFSFPHRYLTPADEAKLLALPEKPPIQLRPIRNSDLEQAHKLLGKYLGKFPIHLKYSLEEFRHWFSVGNDNLLSFVITDKEGKITDLASFYILKSTVIDNSKHKELISAYSFYNVATSVTLESLMEGALIMAKKEGADVFNALEIMDNETFFDKLRFKMGDGVLFYYLYNLKFSKIKQSENSVILF